MSRRCEPQVVKWESSVPHGKRPRNVTVMWSILRSKAWTTRNAWVILIGIRAAYMRNLGRFGIYALALCVPFALEHANELSEYLPTTFKHALEDIGARYKRWTI